MKTKITFLLAAMLLVSVSVSAQSSTTIQGASISKYEATQISNNGNLFIVPLVADLKVKSNVMEEYKLVADITLPEIKKKEKEMEYLKRIEVFLNKRLLELKSQALFEFIDKTGASIIVSPMYSTRTLTSRGLDMKVEVRVKGYPATYSNFRNLQASDSTIVKLNNQIRQKEMDIISIDKKHADTQERTEEVLR